MRSDRFRWLASGLLTITALVKMSALTIAAPPATKPAPPAPMTESEKEDLLGKLMSSNDPTRAAALATALEKMMATPFGRDRAEILQLVVTAGRLAEADDLALKMIEFAPASVATLQRMQDVRARAFLAAGEKSEALSAAKSYFAVCEVNETPAAVALIASCLTHAHPDDATFADRFRAQQKAWSVAGVTPSANDPTLGVPILDAVPLEETRVQALLKAGDDAPAAHKALTSRGNLLLMNGQADEAKVIFEAALESSKDAKQRQIANEGIARALKTKYWSTGLARSFMAALPPP